jgi:aspartate kinase
VLQTRSVGLAMKEGVRVQVLSSFDDLLGSPAADTLPGTMIVGDDDLGDDMERQLITGIAHDKNEAKITLTNVPDKPGAVANIFTPLAEGAINVDMIIQNQSVDGSTDFSFTVPRADYQKALEVLNLKVRGQVKAGDIVGDPKIAKVSVVGIGMRSHVGIASRMFRTLSEEGINIQMISTSEIKIAVVIDEKYMELAVRVLHKAFELEEA